MTVYWIVLAILDEAGYDPVDVHGDDITYATMKRRAHVAQRETAASSQTARGPAERKRRSQRVSRGR